MCWTLQSALSIDSFQRSHACSLKTNQLSLLTRLLQILDSAEEKRPTPPFRLLEFNSGPWSLTSGPAPHRYRPSALPRLCPPLSLQRKITACTAHAAQQQSASIGGLRLSAEFTSSPARLTLQCCSQPSCASPPIPHQTPPAVRAFVRPSSFRNPALPRPRRRLHLRTTALRCVNTLSPAHSSDPALPRPHRSKSLRAVPPISRLVYFLARATVQFFSPPRRGLT